MASKPRRRRHNKQVPAYRNVASPDGTVVAIPVNRKGFKVDERQLRLEATHDRGVIRQAIKDIDANDVAHIPAKLFKNAKLAGYYDKTGTRVVRKSHAEDDAKESILANLTKKVRSAFVKGATRARK